MSASPDLFELLLQLDEFSERQLFQFVFNYFYEIFKRYPEEHQTMQRQDIVKKIIRNLISTQIKGMDPFYFFRNQIETTVPNEIAEPAKIINAVTQKINSVTQQKKMITQQNPFTLQDLSKDVIGSISSFLMVNEVAQLTLVCRWLFATTLNKGHHLNGFDVLTYLIQHDISVKSLDCIKHPSTSVSLTASNWSPHVVLWNTRCSKIRSIYPQMAFGSAKMITTCLHGKDEIWNQFNPAMLSNITKLELFCQPDFDPIYKHSVEKISQYSTTFGNLKHLMIKYFTDEYTNSEYVPDPKLFSKLEVIELLSTSTHLNNLIPMTAPLKAIQINSLSSVLCEFEPDHQFTTLEEIVFAEYESVVESKLTLLSLIDVAPNLKRIAMNMRNVSFYSPDSDIFKDSIFDKLASKPKLQALILRIDVVAHVEYIASWIDKLDKGECFQLTLISRYLWQNAGQLETILVALKNRFKYFELRIKSSIASKDLTWSNIFKHEELDCSLLTTDYLNITVYQSSMDFDRTRFNFSCTYCLNKNINFSFK